MKGTDTSKRSQCDAILAWLKAGNTITPLEALSRFSCMRLGARIYDLREAGYGIVKSTILVKNRDGEDCRVAEYALAPAGKAGEE
ncbi:hypothetical protein D3C76_47720 [compost metagenome]